MKNWINIKRELPPAAGCYLIFQPHFYSWGGGRITIGYWNGEKWMEDINNDVPRQPLTKGVTYWMPLPELPEEKNNDTNN